MAYRRRRHRRLESYKVLIIVFLVTTASFAYLSYFYYQKTEALSLTALNQLERLKEKEGEIEDLKQNVSDLQLEIKSKNITLNDLSNRLGLAQSEIEELTPVIKRYFAAAVTESGEGIIIPFEVKIAKGTGLVAVNIKNVAMLSGVQDSIRTAALVAGDYVGVSMSEKDVDVTFINDLPEVVTMDGPSAGAAITVTIIAGLQEKNINSKIMMTGTINSDGTVGKVGGIQQKAIAARDSGAAVFLVPRGQKVDVSGIEVTEYNKVLEAVDLSLK